jgi:murein DD-endopeptidase MepM/ murein hydrolase activator NlpD
VNLRAAAFLLALALPLHAALFDWPTENRALLEGRPQDFYMYVDRNFEGEASTPWEGGSYGFVRGPQRIAGEMVFTTLHEGIDIAPVRRDAMGNPLDEIRASADGKVVHASMESGASNYGRYIVIEHRIEGSPIYTLYAHLGAIRVHPGQQVKHGEVIGRMGYTGAGINRLRSHLHFEIALRLSEDFDSWHQHFFKGSPNKHGPFNGLNLVGFNPADVLLECSKNPSFRLIDHIRSQQAAYKITVPNTDRLSIISNYPWLVPDGEPANPRAWTVSFTQYGVPIEARAADGAIIEPRLDWVRETPVSYHHATRGIVTGPKESPRLSDSGRRFAELLSGRL